MGRAAPLAVPPVRADHPRLFITSDTIADLRHRCQNVSPISEVYQTTRAWVDSQSSPHGNQWVAPYQFINILIVYMVEDRDPTYLAKAKVWMDHFVGLGTGGDSWTHGIRLKALALGYDWLYPDLTTAERTTYANAIVALADYPRDHRDREGGATWANQYSDYSNQFYWFFSHVAFGGLALAGEAGYEDWATETLDYMEGEITQHMLPATNQVAGSSGGWHEGMDGYTNMTSHPFADLLEAWRTATGVDYFPQSNHLRHLAAWLVYANRPHDQNHLEIADINLPSTWGGNNGAENAYLPLLEARYADPFAKHICDTVFPTGYSGNNWSYLLWYDPDVPDLDFETLPLARHSDGIGWAVMRTGWSDSDTLAVLQAGNFYAGHQHDDQGALLLHRQGTLATEGGMYGYDATHYHNTLLIGGEQIHYGTNQVQHYREMEDTEYDLGDILAFEETPTHAYVRADFSNAYPDDQALHVEREFALLQAGDDSPFAVVFDRVVAADAGQEVTWLLHSMEAPAIDGQTFTVNADDGDGILLGRTLLPAAATLSTTQNELNRWRLEVTADSAQAETLLLHLLHPADAGHTLPTAVVVDAGAMTGLYIQSIGENRVALFSADPWGTTVSQTVSYSVQATAPAHHLLFDLPPTTTFQISAGGLVTTAVSSAQGVLAFRSTDTGHTGVAVHPLGAPPATVADLCVTHAVVGSGTLSGTLTATLRWTAPVNAITYTMRYSGTLISGDDWANAVTVTVPFTASAPGSTEWLTAPVPYTGGPSAGSGHSTVYFALKSQNAEGVWSGLSNNAFWPHFDVYLPAVLRGYGP
jgi:hypothetical protein